MNRIGAAAGLALTLALAGCGQGGQDQNVTNIQVTQGNYQERLRTMDEGERNAVFIRAVRDAGWDCQHVSNSTYQGDQNGNPVWTAHCDNGTTWTIIVGPTGVAQVASAVQANKAGIATPNTGNSQ